ncbi:MAG: transketolase [Rhodoplanes sp.]|uniref:transketolase n=1 Tax=Rhodoplanes sp. TaxID=1968906 RepID=UPI0017B55141|nr:transketolase [Rhodoplanes sp.]NVO16289.1 transketolase [Rhodoplanes sp.]
MVAQELVRSLEEKALRLRELIVDDLIGTEKVGHLGGSCSSAEIVAALYFHKMKHDPASPHAPDRDRFLLSKGHAALVQYAALALAGYFSTSELKTVKSLGSILQGHPDMTKTPGVEANTGSLGQGLSIANGMALGLKLDHSSRKVYVILGDGELNEGQIWEAAMAAARFKLDNVVAILDRNRLQATGPIADRFDIGPVAPKWAAFGWHVIEIDGHDVAAVVEALDEADAVKGQPTIIVANTVKGKGVSFAENNPAFHNGAMTAEQYAVAMKDLQGLRH